MKYLVLLLALSVVMMACTSTQNEDITPTPDVTEVDTNAPTDTTDSVPGDSVDGADQAIDELNFDDW